MGSSHESKNWTAGLKLVLFTACALVLFGAFAGVVKVLEFNSYKNAPACGAIRTEQSECVFYTTATVKERVIHNGDHLLDVTYDEADKYPWLIGLVWIWGEDTGVFEHADPGDKVTLLIWRGADREVTLEGYTAHLINRPSIEPNLLLIYAMFIWPGLTLFVWLLVVHRFKAALDYRRVRTAERWRVTCTVLLGWFIIWLEPAYWFFSLGALLLFVWAHKDLRSSLQS